MKKNVWLFLWFFMLSNGCFHGAIRLKTNVPNPEFILDTKVSRMEQEDDLVLIEDTPAAFFLTGLLINAITPVMIYNMPWPEQLETSDKVAYGAAMVGGVLAANVIHYYMYKLLYSSKRIQGRVKAPGFSGESFDIQLPMYQSPELALKNKKTMNVFLKQGGPQRLFDLLDKTGFQKIAVIPESPRFESAVSHFIAYRGGKFKVIERSQEKLVELLKEQGFSGSGAVDTSSSHATLGKMLGVELLVYLKGDPKKSSSVQVRLVAVETGQILFHDGFPLKEMDEYSRSVAFQEPQTDGSETDPVKKEPEKFPISGKILVLASEQNVSGTVIHWAEKSTNGGG